MAREHHYLPVSVLSRFSTPWAMESAASELPSAAVKHYRKKRLQSGGYRQWPIVVHSKSLAKTRVLPAEKACKVRDLYRLATQADEYDYGVEQLLLKDLLGLDLPPVGCDAELRAVSERLGEEPLPRDIVERELTVGVDTPAARLFRRVRSNGEFEDSDLHLLLRFLGLAEVRSRAWVDNNRETLPNAILRAGRSLGPIAIRPENRDVAEDFFSAVSRVMHGNIYPTAVLQSVKGNWELWNQIDARVTLLRAPPETPFLTADNAARPYNPDHVAKLRVLPRPGFRLRSTVMTFPIGPRHCLLLSTHPKIPPNRSIELSSAEVHRVNLATLTMAVDEVVLPGPAASLLPPDTPPDVWLPWPNNDEPVYSRNREWWTQDRCTHRVPSSNLA